MPSKKTAAASSPPVTPVYDFFYQTKSDQNQVLKAANTVTKIISPETFWEPDADNVFDTQQFLAVIASMPTPPDAPGSGQAPKDILKAIAAIFDEGSMVADPEADQLLRELHDPLAHERIYIPPIEPGQFSGVSRPPTASELAATAKRHFAASGKEELTPEFLTERLGTGFALPEWVNVEQIERASIFHWERIGMIYMILLHGSLGGGFGVPRVDQVLNATGRLGSTDHKRALRRLVETTDMITNSFHSDVRQLTEVGGIGWRSNVKVRLIHASIRYRLHAKLRDDSHVPINQTDMVATLLSFSTVVLVAMLKLGYRPTRQELDDYSAAWRYIGFLNGVQDNRYFATYNLGLLTSPSPSGGVIRGPTPTNTQSIMLSGMLSRRVFSGVASVLTSTTEHNPADPLALVRRIYAAITAPFRSKVDPSSPTKSRSGNSSTFEFALGFHAALLCRLVGTVNAARLGIVRDGSDRWKLSKLPPPDMNAKENAGVVVETVKFNWFHMVLALFTIWTFRFSAWLTKLPIVGAAVRRKNMQNMLKTTLELYASVVGRKVDKLEGGRVEAQ
ncbi:hypothetical protein DFJ73DRAFT_796821 [Zopfochytrium polystomum]|nr:hypothetical protein DFJ73DRAFT_796821 [Zopfochytrium polystomum]